MNVCKLTCLMHLEKTMNAPRAAVNPAYLQSPGNASQMGFLRWPKLRVSAGKAPRWTMWRWPHASCSDQLRANTADLEQDLVEQGLWPRTARKGGFIRPVRSRSNLGLCLHAFHAKGVKWNSGLAMGLHETSSWALIPVLLLTHWVASGKSVGLYLNFHSWGKKDCFTEALCALSNWCFYSTF